MFTFESKEKNNKLNSTAKLPLLDHLGTGFFYQKAGTILVRKMNYCMYFFAKIREFIGPNVLWPGKRWPGIEVLLFTE